MSKQEFYDPQQKNYQFYSSQEERLSLQSERFKEKMRENQARARRTKRIVLANLVIILILSLFISVGFPFLVARTSVEGIRFHISVVKVDQRAGEIVGIVKMKKSSPVAGDLIVLKARLGDQQKELTIESLEVGRPVGKELFFLFDPNAEYLILEISVGDQSAVIRSPINRFSFF